ncbi:BREX-2 system adenine-specific DNA-methyltransferase PglX [Micromonospora sp. NPDC048930]|uniref:BREX-2 system adenine-specific DNA-methyltransferase PglX n=1 Tax=Micromonospora sp. NPDC048930 TaxID=3364261 RepID=UPI003716C221
MTAEERLTGELRAELKALEDDLRRRVATQPAVDRAWRDQHQEALQCGRTAGSWQEWSDDRVTQAAVAWILTAVFIRFAEDNKLVKPVWISGPKERRQEALNAQAEFLRTEARTNPDVTDREWLLHAITYLAGMPATRELVDETSALWLVTPSGDAAARLLAFWRERDENGELLRDLSDESLDTRFLGDLYQELSLAAQEKYALKQTPVFVEEFILDRTLDPALNERPLDGFKLIDPTCGSGHFLLGAFARLRERWERHAPGMERRARVQKALDAIHGVDLNPFAVAIARFRLTIAAMQASGDEMLESAPAFNYHLAVGDSLLHGLDQLEIEYGAEYSADRTAATYAYPTENLAALQKILGNGRYDVVVGNPPYITVKDKALNQGYRKRYHYCKGTYALTVPFMERFFALAKAGERPGWVGQITSNSFMKREFGVPLIEKFLPTKDLQFVIDSEGAWIPGHNTDGTPTVILIGMNRRPVKGVVRAVLSNGLRETRSSGDKGQGPYWTSLANHLDELGFENDWVTISDLDRGLLATHPWSLSGGGTLELQSAIDSRCSRRLADMIAGQIGFASFPGADDAFFAPKHALSRDQVPHELARPVITGDVVRDWSVTEGGWALAPYDEKAKLIPIAGQPWLRRQWPYKTVLGAVTGFGGVTKAKAGEPWWSWYRWVAARYLRPLSITFAEVATHNHFVLDRGGKVFKQTAPVIKLPEGSTEDDHLGLLAVLNSSTACFWLRNRTKPKGGAADQAWQRTYQFNASNVEEFPLPSTLPFERARRLDHLAQRLAELTPAAIVAAGIPSRESLDDARHAFEAVRAEMIGRQEELDWTVYRLYGLIDEDLTYPGDDLPGLELGQRAFEMVLARRVDKGEEQTAWFERHGSTPATEIPGRWPAAYRDLVQRRIELVESHPYLKLLERPEHKRRWGSEPWEKSWERREERALRDWLLDRLEDRRFWFDRAGAPVPRSVAQLADDVSRDAELVSVLALWEGRPDVSVVVSLQRLLAEEAVPYLAAYRYTESGLRSREAWEHTWALQRREDKGEKFGTGPDNPPIPVPPKYAPADFVRKEYWAHRGKLDVPKERFILYPEAGRDNDPTPLLGWAGWDYSQQAFALDQLLRWRETEGAPDEKLIPLVAGLAELLPWVEQWHTEPDAFYGGVSAAEFFREQVDLRGRQVERTREQLAAWCPEPSRRGRGRKAKTA